MNSINGKSSEALPVVVHFGCGQLGVGAVIPFLIKQYGSSHQIVAVQRRSEKWRQVPSNIILPMRTTAGDCMPFRTAVLEEDRNKLPESFKTATRLLLLVPDIQYCYDLLVDLHALSSKELIISCSLGPGQLDLIQLLSIFPSWEKTFIFENRLTKEWKNTLDGKPYYHILVDRICWHLEFAVGKSPSILCHCEDNVDKDGNKNVSFLWPKSAEIPTEVKDSLPPPPGEKILSDEWVEKSYNENEKEWHLLRKRALINAPHSLASLFCYRLLASREMEPTKQYLAPIQEMLRVAHPEWKIAMDHYLRLRAIEVAYEHQKRNDDEINDIDITQELLHSDYHDAYWMARRALRRFFDTNDRLDRLMSPSNLSKELEKFDEHILKPLKFYDEKSSILVNTWSYGRPNDTDILCLRDFLTETFLEATRFLAKLSVHKEQLYE